MSQIQKLKHNYPFNISFDFQPKIYCQNEETQIWFNRALFWFYSFNHEECIRCCDQGILIEEKCAMLYFLKSIAVGVNYNNCPELLEKQQASLQFQAWQKADQYKNKTQELENDLINALKYRVGDGIKLEHKQNNIQFSQQMQNILENYKNKVDKNTFNFISEITAESIMLLRPWDLWVQHDQIENNLKQGDPYENTLLISKIIENGLQKDSKHPGLRHLWIHLYELSSEPEKALDENFSQKLRDIVPESGHLCHMPSHIEILCGKYQQSIESNLKGIAADDKYFEYIKNEKLQEICFYMLYRCHNLHFLVYSALFAAKKEIALQYADKMTKLVTIDYLKDTSFFQPMGADWMEGFISVKIHVLIRFGLWEQLISDEPFGKEILPIQQILENQEFYSATLAYIYYGKGIAYAVLAGKNEKNYETYILQANDYLQKFKDQKQKVPSSRMIFNNSQHDILKIAEQMLIGEIAYREQNYQKSFEALKLSVNLDDNLPYDEPWGWMVPTRHAYAALMLEQGIQTKNNDLVSQAMKIYKEDLGEGMRRCVQHKGNVWSLSGLNMCYKYFKMQKEIDELKPELEQKLSEADIQINSSCLCSLRKNSL
ncbi:hypothetical protein PPERSA_04029 [Pseudocohnilembus persalinus]|uniref:Tetratricopeptide repeat protein n=1 Tax=Pseudocohnilembus persalinus TaxID=266149 RepID=A0A0V0QKZ6_PSEPJ|nr:hypothetical protein PPERSA_04029 [Pseudocohnilembus persalinus]|eukprot:KRX02826.1 hypothetical protein PPERSA_04029 [Pseudocohnilembus persalinus]